MAQALVDHYGGSTALKAGHALHDALLKNVLRPVDSFSSLEGVRVGSTPCVEDAAWKVSDSRSLYAVKGWGGPYFSVDDTGRLRVTPSGAIVMCLGCYETAHRVSQTGGIDVPVLMPVNTSPRYGSRAGLAHIDHG